MSSILEADRGSGSASDLAEPECSAVMVRAAGLGKSFGATRALHDCSLEIRAGEVHVILGENGSGKSTLVKLLSGVQRPDQGSFEIGGQPVTGFSSPAAAARAGVVAVFQEVLVAEPCSVLDNIWLGTDRLFRDGMPRAERERQARAVLEALLLDPPDLDRPAEDLPLSDRQACCIARALVRRARVLILDEATSALDVATRDRLFALLRRLRAEQVAIVFISHRMDEIAEIGDRITVMRSGSVVGSRLRGEASTAELMQMMTGEQPGAVAAYERVARDQITGDPVLSISDLRLTAECAPISFELRAGELVGLAGLEGHGQDLFLKGAWGGRVAGGQVLRLSKDGSTQITSPAVAARSGVVYVPRERRSEALLTHMSIRANFVLPTVARDTVWGRVSDRHGQRRLDRYVKQLRIRMGDPGDAIETLSGGNQQKVVMSRWLAADPQILLLNDPTRGVDIGAKRDLYALLEQLTAQGVAVLMLSTEVDEHIELMDRVLVFRDGQLAAEIARADLSRGALISSFFGTEQPTALEEAHS